MCDFLLKNGIEKNRLVSAPKQWIQLQNKICFCAVPASHPTIELDSQGHWQHVGYLIEFNGTRIYHAGDTALTSELVAYLEQIKPIDVAFLPVNEINYVRNQCGIIGNMSLRDAFYLANKLSVKKLVPMHWDMFLPNAVYLEEIELYYRLSNPSFKLLINPTKI